MLNGYKYNESEMKEILKSINIIIDSREKSNNHIISWFDTKKIPYTTKKMDSADYSFYIPANPELSIHRDVYFTDQISIERKANLDELAGNFATDRDRIEDEFLRHKGKMILLIEDSCYKDACEGNYKSKYSAQSFLGSLHSFSDRYSVPFIFLDKDSSGCFIYCSFYYFLRNLLK